MAALVFDALNTHDLRRLAYMATAIALLWALAFWLSGKGGRWKP